jgi:hypothetical protein
VLNDVVKCWFRVAKASGGGDGRAPVFQVSKLNKRWAVVDRRQGWQRSGRAITRSLAKRLWVEICTRIYG